MEKVLNNFAMRYENNIHTEIILNIAKGLNCNNYLEIGCGTGRGISRISEFVNNCIGVDVIDGRLEKNFQFIKCTSDIFFKDNVEIFDVIFIDGDHHYEVVKKDFENSLKFLSEYGVIFLHDNDPIEKKYTDQKFCGDSYKIIDYIYENHKNLNIITLPTDISGLSIVNRKNDRRVLKYI